MLKKTNSYVGISGQDFGRTSRSTVPQRFLSRTVIKPTLNSSRLASSQKVLNTLDKTRSSLTDRDTFRQRMEIKKMAVARASGAYDQNELLKDRLEKKMADQSERSYNTSAKKIEESLRRQDELATNPLLRKVNQPVKTGIDLPTSSR